MEKNPPLCKTCDNRDVAYVLVSGRYTPKLICVYDMSNFPSMHKCDKYVERQYEGDER